MYFATVLRTGSKEQRPATDNERTHLLSYGEKSVVDAYARTNNTRSE